MSEFFDAHILRCSVCKRQFASCEGLLCDCMEAPMDEKPEVTCLACDWEGFPEDLIDAHCPECGSDDVIDWEDPEEVE